MEEDIKGLLSQIKEKRYYDMEGGRSLCRELLKAGMEREEEEAIMMAYYYDGIIQLSSGDAIGAMESFNQIHLRLPQNELNVYHAYIYNGMLLVARHMNDSLRAIEYGTSAIRYLKRKIDQKLVAIVQTNLSDVYMKLDNYPKALSCLKKAIMREQDIHFSYTNGVSLLNLGIVQGKMENYEEARKTLLRAIPYLEQVKNYVSIGLAYEALAYITFKMDEKLVSVRYITKSLDSIEQYGADWDVYTNRYDFIKFLLEIGETETVKLCLSRDYEKNKKLNKHYNCTLICSLGLKYYEKYRTESDKERLYRCYCYHTEEYKKEVEEYRRTAILYDFEGRYI